MKKNTELEHLNFDDIIYHYTKTNVAIDYILYESRLRFNSNKNSIDPFENCKNDWDSQLGTIQDGRPKINLFEKFKSFKNELTLLQDSFQQICFCKNKSLSNNELNFIDNFDNFGFTKMRMWDQYGDRFNGVCIAFSKKKLLEKNKNIKGLYCDDVIYKDYNGIKVYKNKTVLLNDNSIAKFDEYSHHILEMAKSQCFIKHIDYKDENEYRIGIFPEKKTTSHVKDNYLNILNCVEAVFITTKINKKQAEDLYNYSIKYGFKLFQIHWNTNDIIAYDYSDILSIEEEIYNIFYKD